MQIAYQFPELAEATGAGLERRPWAGGERAVAGRRAARHGSGDRRHGEDGKQSRGDLGLGEAAVGLRPTADVAEVGAWLRVTRRQRSTRRLPRHPALGRGREWPADRRVRPALSDRRDAGADHLGGARSDRSGPPTACAPTRRFPAAAPSRSSTGWAISPSSRRRRGSKRVLERFMEGDAAGAVQRQGVARPVPATADALEVRRAS